MQLTFLGATGTVTGSRYLLSDGDTSILIDCGLYQGKKKLRQRNWQNMPLNAEDISAVFLTHAHLDHSGYIPRLIKEGFNSDIYCTKATQKLCEILLADSGHLQEEEANYANRKKYSSHTPALPLYTEQDARDSFTLFKGVEFNQPISIGSFSIQFKSAGHILGAASIHITHGQKTIVFSGDVGRLQDVVMNPPAAIGKADYLITESTYGNRLHEEKDCKEALADIVCVTAARGGVVLIPSFAVGRAQAIMHLLAKLKHQQDIPSLPVYLDSPMAINASQLFCDFQEEHRLSQQQCMQMCEDVTYTRSVEESQALSQLHGPAVIISASGMMTGGRILHHMKSYAPDWRNSIVLVGFQAAGTRGQHISQGASTVRIHGLDVSIKADVHTIHGLSAHADYAELIKWFETLSHSPKTIFITHGEARAASELRHRLRHRLSDRLDCPIEIPEYLQSYEL